MYKYLFSIVTIAYNFFFFFFKAFVKIKAKLVMLLKRRLKIHFLALGTVKFFKLFPCNFVAIFQAIDILNEFGSFPTIQKTVI